jgi:hypothetical protein
MDVVIHSYLRTPPAACVEQRLAQLRQITPPIVVVSKAGQSIVAALVNVLRNAGQVESSLFGYRIRISLLNSCR